MLVLALADLDDFARRALKLAGAVGLVRLGVLGCRLWKVLRAVVLLVEG